GPRSSPTTANVASVARPATTAVATKTNTRRGFVPTRCSSSPRSIRNLRRARYRSHRGAGLIVTSAIPATSVRRVRAGESLGELGGEVRAVRRRRALRVDPHALRREQRPLAHRAAPRDDDGPPAVRLGGDGERVVVEDLRRRARDEAGAGERGRGV